MTLSAAFTVNSVANPAEHTVAYSSTVTLEVASLAYNTITWTIVGSSKSGEATPTITLTGTPPGRSATFPMPATPGDDLGRSFRVRCRVRDARGNTDEQHAIIGAVNGAGLLPLPVGEDSGERNATHGWTEVVNAGIAAAGAAANPLETVKSAVRLATVAALPAHSFDAGLNKMTASSNGALSVDATAVANGDRILVKNEAATHLQHGIYTVTDLGSGSTPWILTRATDWDASNEFESGTQILVMAGATLILQRWALTTPAIGVAIVLNTTALGFSFAGGAITGQNDVTLTSLLKLRDARLVNIVNAGTGDTGLSAADTQATSEGVPLEVTSGIGSIDDTLEVANPMLVRKGGLITAALGRSLRQKHAIVTDTPRQQVFANASAVGANTFTQSSAFDNAAWTKTNATVTPNTDGAYDTVTASSTARTGVEQTPTALLASGAASGTATISIDADAGTTDWIYIEVNSTQRTWFQLTGFGVVGTRNNNHAAKIEPLGSNKYRCTIKFAYTGGVVFYGLASANNTQSADNTDTVLLSNAQAYNHAEILLGATAGTGGSNELTVCAYWFYEDADGDDIGPAWNRMREACPAINADFDDERAPIVYKICEGGGAFRVRTPMDFTCLRGRQRIDLAGTHLYLRVPRNKVGIDCIGSTDLDWTGCNITIEDCGIALLFARPRVDMAKWYGARIVTVSSGATSGRHNLSDMRISGAPAIAPHYNIASESNNYSRCYFVCENAYDNHETTITSTVLVGDTTINITAGTGTAGGDVIGTGFHDPADGNGDVYITISGVVAADPVNGFASYRVFEVVKVGTRNANSFTGCTRGQHNTTAREWNTATYSDILIGEHSRHTWMLCDEPATIDLVEIAGWGTISPHGDPGQGVGGSSVGNSIKQCHVRGDVTQANLHIKGFGKIDADGVYCTGGLACHAAIDASTSGVAGITLRSYYSHGSGKGNPESSIEFRGAGQGSDIIGVKVDARSISAGKYAVKVRDALTLTKSDIEWFDAQGLTTHTGSRLEQVNLTAAANAPSPIVLPTELAGGGGGILTNGRFSGTIRCRERAQIILAGDMMGGRIEGVGHFDRATGTRIPCEIIEFGTGNSSARIRDGFRVTGKPGANLPNENKTIIVPTGTWYLLASNTLSGNRDYTLGTAGAVLGDTIEIARGDTNNFTAAIINGGPGAGTLHTFTAGNMSVAVFNFDGTDWAVGAGYLRKPEFDAPALVDIPLPGTWAGYYDVDIFQQGDASAVDTWYALEGATDLITPGTSPTFSRQGFDGRPAIRFASASSQYFTADALSSIQNGDDLDVTVFWQGKQVTTSGTQSPWAFSNSAATTQRFRQALSSSNWFTQRRGDSGGTLTAPTDAAGPAGDLLSHVWCLRMTGTQAFLYCDDMTDAAELLGVLTGGSGAGLGCPLNTATMTSDRFTVGAAVITGPGSPTDYLNAYMRRFAIRDSDMSTEADRVSVATAWLNR